MTKKDYIAAARAIAQAYADYGLAPVCGPRGGRETTDDFREGMSAGIGIIISRIADVFAADNPRFDRARFLDACGVPRAR